MPITDVDLEPTDGQEALLRRYYAARTDQDAEAILGEILQIVRKQSSEFIGLLTAGQSRHGHLYEPADYGGEVVFRATKKLRTSRAERSDEIRDLSAYIRETSRTSVAEEARRLLPERAKLKRSVSKELEKGSPYKRWRRRFPFDWYACKVEWPEPPPFAPNEKVTLIHRSPAHCSQEILDLWQLSRTIIGAHKKRTPMVKELIGASLDWSIGAILVASMVTLLQHALHRLDFKTVELKEYTGLPASYGLDQQLSNEQPLEATWRAIQALARKIPARPEVRRMIAALFLGRSKQSPEEPIAILLMDLQIAEPESLAAILGLQVDEFRELIGRTPLSEEDLGVYLGCEKTHVSSLRKRAAYEIKRELERLMADSF